MALVMVFGVFQSLGDTGRAISWLLEAKVPRPSLSLLAHGGNTRLVRDPSRGDFCGLILPDVPGHERLRQGNAIALTAADLPDVGPMLAMGGLAPAIAVPTVPAGPRIVLELRGLGVSEEDAAGYLGAVRSGYAVLGVGSPGALATAVADILSSAGAMTFQDAIASPHWFLHEPSRRLGHPSWLPEEIQFPRDPTTDVAFVLPTLGLPGKTFHPYDPFPDLPGPGQQPQQPGQQPQQPRQQPRGVVLYTTARNPSLFGW